MFPLKIVRFNEILKCQAHSRRSRNVNSVSLLFSFDDQFYNKIPPSFVCHNSVIIKDMFVFNISWAFTHLFSSHNKQL